MRHKTIETVVEKATELGTLAEDLVRALNSFEDNAGNSFETRRTIRGRDSSIAEVVGRIHSAVGMVAEFSKATRADLVPLQTITNLQTAINETIAAINNLIALVNNVSRSQGGLQSFNYDNFHALSKNGGNHNLQGQFHAVFDTSETFLQRFFESLQILRPRGAYSFQSAASAISSIIGEASESLRDLKSSLTKVVVSENDLALKVEQAATHVEEIKRLKTDGAADRKTVSDYLAEVTQQKAAVQAMYDEANSLQSAVKTYQTDFEQFQKQLDNREATFTEGTESLNALIANFEQQREGVESLIQKSTQMLSSATVSGLAANFSAMTEKLTKELRSARFAFYVGIAFLTISAIPLLAFVLLPIVAPFLKGVSLEILATAMEHRPGSAQNGWQYLGQVVARITILLPAAWFVSFAAIRHSSLFRLREHYAYKYSMAVAVEGFKQQAPHYEQEIAALVLEQLAFNPADKLVPSKEIREGRIPGITGYLIEKIRSRVERFAAVDIKKQPEQ